MGFSLHCGDSMEVVAGLPAGFDVILTSPPYFAARDYGVDGSGALRRIRRSSWTAWRP